jgi:hypothetical protein
MPDSPRTTSLIEVRGAKLWAIESSGDLKDSDLGGVSNRNSQLFWKVSRLHGLTSVRCIADVIQSEQTKGFVQLGEVEKASITSRQGNGLVLPDFEVS